MGDWTDNMPWIENENFPKTIVEKVNILELLDNFKIEYTVSSSGDFTHKMRCPLPIHGDGCERTASCFISEKTNKFYCFGCNNGGSVIDFIKLYTGKPFGETLKWLANFAGITNSDVPSEEMVKEKKDPEKTIKTWVLRSGLIIRKYIEEQKGKSNYLEWCEWADKRFKKLDEIMNMQDKDWEKAKNYYNKVKNHLDKK